ncbi:MAG: hypothetical protein MET45_04035 [Nostoc sp. LLA-1]|nr:hypothetical protein [Cyanocohniella sp. LLY]
MCTQALNALGILRKQQEEPYLTHQNLVEFWRSATRAVERNGLGLTLLQAETELQCLEMLFPILPDVPAI